MTITAMFSDSTLIQTTPSGEPLILIADRVRPTGKPVTRLDVKGYLAVLNVAGEELDIIPLVSWREPTTTETL